MKEVLIIGAGLCGSLLALRLAQHGFEVTLVEKRPDLRKVTLDAGRSINMALSDRGVQALQLVGLEEAAREKLCIPMTGRMIHETSGKTFLSPYSGREDEYINSISRPGLNKLLLDAVDTMNNVRVIFNHECIEVDFEKAAATFRNPETKETLQLRAAVIFGTDGSGSAVRSGMIHDSSFRFNISRQWLEYGYKELELPADAGSGYRIYKNALHIWPRGKHMLIALPNKDGSFTVTLFLAYKNKKDSFETLTTKEKISDFFKREFPDIYELIPDLSDQFLKNPIGAMGTVKCSPWHHSGKTLLLGDSVHAMVPFYGQGMNAGFEDIYVLDQYIKDEVSNLQQGKTSWETIFEAYEKERKKDADAICDLSLDNFYEMMAHTGIELFQKKRQLETAFESKFPQQYFSKYSMVTFDDSISYSEAMKLGRAQDKAILRLLHSGRLPESMDLEEKLRLVKSQTKAILKEEEKPDYLQFN